MSIAANNSANENAGAAIGKPEQRRALAVASGTHALHDGYTDLVLVMLPIWQAEFGIGYAALGLLRTCFSGTMASLQIPAAMLSERYGVPAVLAVGTALSGAGYLIAGGSTGFWMLVVALVIGGIGSSTQHPLASELVARAHAGPGSLKALGAYNFSGDVGKMSVPALASLMLVVLPWQPVVALLGFAGLVAAAVIYWLSPRFAVVRVGDDKVSSGPQARVGNGAGFSLLLAIGMIDSATRMGFLVFLPFVLIGKGASLPVVGLALTLVFAGGAVGKLVCAFIGARIGVIATVCLTESLTVVGIVALLPLPLEWALIVLPVIGIMLNGTSSVLYGSVPELVPAEKRSRAFGLFYTGTIGCGAVSPVIYGFVGDRFDVSVAYLAVAVVCLLTLPLALLLRPMLAAQTR
jgi:MFS transporter, FSR family, fosmidomycin resistance protein